MIFHDREDAGRKLAKELAEFAHRDHVLVLGIPRGGVTVAFEVAQSLHAPLDVLLSHKLGVPGHEELAFGAIAAGSGRFLDRQVIHAAGISPEQIERVAAEVNQMLDRRAALYRGDRPPIQAAGRTVLLVDDGIATGASTFAAVSALREMKPALLVLATPVAPASSSKWLARVVDRLVCLQTPRDFYSVGQFYQSFSQVTDEEVISLLRRAA